MTDWLKKLTKAKKTDIYGMHAQTGDHLETEKKHQMN